MSEKDIERYKIIKDVAGGVYNGLSLIFPAMPGWVASRRTECMINVCKKAQEKIDASGLSEEQIQHCSLKLGIPFAENASLEENPSLQDLWANLLANALTPDKKTDRYPYFVSILKEISPLDAKTLSLISMPVKAPRDTKLPPEFSLDKDENILHSDGTLLRPTYTKNLTLTKKSNGQVMPLGLSRNVTSAAWSPFLEQLNAPAEDVQISIETLENLGLISAVYEANEFSVSEDSQVLARGTLQITPLGFAFIGACIEDAGHTIE